MRRLCMFTTCQFGMRVLIWGTKSTSNVPRRFDSLGVACRRFHSPSTVVTRNESEMTSFFLAVVSDLQKLQQKCSRSFRVCISSDSLVVVEAATGDTRNWLPVMSVDAAKFPSDISKCVEDALATSSMTQHGVTLVDLRARAEDVAVAQKFIAERFPRLQLHIDHSKGTDLQGTVTHTVTVSLRVIGSPDDLSAEERVIKESFLGESVGVSFAHTARRALLEAFDVAGLSPPPTQRSTEEGQRVNELGIYLDIIENATGEKVDIISSLDDDQVRVFIKTRNGRQLDALNGRHEDVLSIVLASVEKASEKVNSIATEAARKRIADHPVVLALPSKGLRPKKVLHRLLFHTYGLPEDRVHINTSQSDGGTFLTTVDVDLCFVDWMNAGSSSVVSTISKAAGVNKKSSEALACMMAIQRCFPRIFEDQLLYHAEVKEIMNSSKATRSGSICPHISRGLLAQLRWAAHCQGKQVLLDVLQLHPNSENEDLGIRTTRNLWATQLFLVDGNNFREFICLALDPKKSLSEQKAVAAALWKCYREECKEGVKYAIDHGLINEDGDCVPCEGISSSVPPVKSDYEIADESDPFISKLQLLPSQPVSVPYRQSLLSLFRRGAQQYVDLLNERCGGAGSCSQQLIEYTERDTGDGSFRAQLVMKKVMVGDTNCEITPTPLGEEVCSSTAIEALFRALKALFEAGGVIWTSAEKDSEVREIYLDTCQRVADLSPFPTELPASTPLETVAHCVMIKYGLSLELRISGGGKAVNVQLFGKSPTSLGADISLKPTHFFLGHGRGGSLLKAVVSCCKGVFGTHICCGKEAFETVGVEVVKYGSVDIIPRGTSLLMSRTEDVKKELTENGAVSMEASVCVKVDIQTSPSPSPSPSSSSSSSSVSDVVYEAHLSVLDGARTVELERTSPAAHLITSLQNLTESVSQEMGGPPVDISAMLRKFSGPLLCNTLEQMLQELYGLSLVVDTELNGRFWCCQLSIHLSKDLYYGIGGAVSTRKKEAVEMAAACAVEHCFGQTSQVVKLVSSGARAAATTTPDTSSAETAHVMRLSGFVYRRVGITSNLQG